MYPTHLGKIIALLQFIEMNDISPKTSTKIKGLLSLDTDEQTYTVPPYFFLDAKVVASDIENTDIFYHRVTHSFSQLRLILDTSITYAVRSAGDEDSSGSPNAGKFYSATNVDSQNVAHEVANVLKSCLLGTPPSNILNVIVQEMIPFRTSLVASRDNIVLAHGACSTIVDQTNGSDCFNFPMTGEDVTIPESLISIEQYNSFSRVLEKLINTHGHVEIEGGFACNNDTGEEELFLVQIRPLPLDNLGFTLDDIALTDAEMSHETTAMHTGIVYAELMDCRGIPIADISNEIGKIVILDGLSLSSLADVEKLNVSGIILMQAPFLGSHLRIETISKIKVPCAELSTDTQLTFLNQRLGECMTLTVSDTHVCVDSENKTAFYHDHSCPSVPDSTVLPPHYPPHTPGLDILADFAYATAVNDIILTEIISGRTSPLAQLCTNDIQTLSFFYFRNPLFFSYIETFVTAFQDGLEKMGRIFSGSPLIESEFEVINCKIKSCFLEIKSQQNRTESDVQYFLERVQELTLSLSNEAMQEDSLQQLLCTLHKHIISYVKDSGSQTLVEAGVESTQLLNRVYEGETVNDTTLFVYQNKVQLFVPGGDHFFSGTILFDQAQEIQSVSLRIDDSNLDSMNDEDHYDSARLRIVAGVIYLKNIMQIHFPDFTVSGQFDGFFFTVKLQRQAVDMEIDLPERMSIGRIVDHFFCLMGRDVDFGMSVIKKYKHY